jgi:hypothetical protein
MHDLNEETLHAWAMLIFTSIWRGSCKLSDETDATDGDKSLGDTWRGDSSLLLERLVSGVGEVVARRLVANIRQSACGSLITGLIGVAKRIPAAI